MKTNTNLNLQNKRMFILLFSQALWHTLYLLALTVWRDISVFPTFASASEILDETRWFWLMEDPNSGGQHGLLISNMMHLVALTEVLFCLIWLFIHIKSHWRISSVKAKTSYVTIILTGAIISALFGWQMRSNFIDMTEYYFLWQRELIAEILAVVIALFALTSFLSSRHSAILEEPKIKGN